MSSPESCRICTSLEGASLSPDIVWQNEHWAVRHSPHPYGVAGWMTIYSKRHVAGIAYFTDEEAADFGPTLRGLELALEQSSQALRIYTVAMGESVPHFHCHMVPRYASLPGDASGWDVFLLQREAAEGRITVDPTQVASATAAFRAALGG